MQIEYSKTFIKKFKKCPPQVKSAFKQRLKLFIQDKHHHLLNNHTLTGKLKVYRSINITGDWRALFEELEQGRVIYFVIIGTHSELYK